MTLPEPPSGSVPGSGTDPAPSAASDRRARDLELHRRVCGGDQSALADVYAEAGRAVYAVARRVLNDPGMAEDVVQVVFLRLWNEPLRFDPARGALKSFLFREAHSRAVERVRAEVSRRAREERNDREDLAPGVDIEREVVDLIRSERVRAAMASLSDGERDAINLAYFGGHTYREVARLLDLPEGTVKSRIRIGLTKLAKRLEGLGWGGPDGAE